MMRTRRRSAGPTLLTVACVMIVTAGYAVRHAAAQPPGAALTHFSHVATGFAEAPAGRGLAVTAAVETNAAMLHANFAAGRPTDLEAMKSSVRQVLQALAPAAGTTGPGLGFGLRRAVDAIATHIDMAVRARDASATMKRLGPTIATAARAVSARAQAMTELGNRVLAAPTAAEALPLVTQLRALALELDTGADANGSGRIELDTIEPGMNQLEAQVYAVFEGEKIARILK